MTDGIVIASIISVGGVIIASVLKFAPSRNGKNLVSDFKEALREVVGEPLNNLTLIESKADQKHDIIINNTSKTHQNVSAMKEQFGEMVKDVGFIARDQNTLFQKYDTLNDKTVKIEVNK